MTSAALREEVSVGCHALEEHGLSDLIWGHVSARDPDGRGAWLKPAGLGFTEVDATDVHLVGWDGSLREGTGVVHMESPIHTEILAARPDVGAVVHAHPESAVVFGATDLVLRPLGHEGSLFSPPDVPRFTETGDLIRTPELGRAVAHALGGANAVLLHNHGIVTVGPDVGTAVLTAIYLEKACRMQLAAAATGSQLHWSADDEALAKRGRVYRPDQFAGGWRYLVRSVHRSLMP